MREHKNIPDGCLDAETLAAFVDGGLTAGERSQVELHLAACRVCFAAFTESVKTVQAMTDSGEFAAPGTDRLRRHASSSTRELGGGRGWPGRRGGSDTGRLVAAGRAARACGPGRGGG